MTHPGLFLTHIMTPKNLCIYSTVNEFSWKWESGAHELLVRYVIEGREQYNIDRHEFRVTEGSLLLVNKGCAHEGFSPYTRQPVRGFCISLDSWLINEVYHTCVSSDEALLGCPKPAHENVFDVYEGIYQRDDILNKYFLSLAKNAHCHNGTIQSEPEELFYNVAERLLMSQKMIKNRIGNIKANKHSTREELYKRVSKAKEIMDDEAKELVTVSHLANAVALSEFHFYRVFRQTYGISPHQYQLKQRMQRIKKMLITENTSLADIARGSGFADLQTFTKAFKKEFAVSPGKFRHIHQS